MSTAKKLQTKLFGQPAPSKKSTTDIDVDPLADARSATPTPAMPGLAAGTAGEGLKIDIPSLEGEQQQREKEKWVKYLPYDGLCL